jgi:glycosyltransferase involved in cell wall biosynthesis
MAMSGRHSKDAAMTRDARLLSVVVPVFNEEHAVEAFYAALEAAVVPLGVAVEVLFVDDGSTDGTRERLRDLHRRDRRVRVIAFSRNFGKEAALAAGLDHARGDVVVPIDVDLQDPPELIATFLARWREGYDVAYGVRNDRGTDSALKRTTAGLFYRWFNRVAADPIPNDTGDFRLMDRRVVEALRRLPERNRFTKGLFAWVGFKSIAVPYKRQERVAGKTRFNFWRLWVLALDGITGFSTLPLRIWTFVGLAVACLALAYGVFIVVHALASGIDVPGYASTMTVILFLGGVQLITLGVIGEYVSRLFIESKQRPLYLVDEEIGSGRAPEERDRQELREAMRLLRRAMEHGKAAPAPAAKGRRQKTG